TVSDIMTTIARIAAGETASRAPRMRALGRLGALAALSIAASGTCLLLSPDPAAADVLKDIGRFFGKPLGGFVEAATVPAVQRAEASAHRILSDVDVRVQNRIGQARLAGESIVSKVDKATEARVAQVDSAAEARLAQADGIIAARVAQVDASVDARLSQAIGGLSQLERQAIGDAQKLVKKVDAVAEQRIAQVDAVIGARIGQVRGTVQEAIAQADEAAQGRIEQLDEVAERRLGSVDVIASKLSLNLQITLLKVGALLGMVAFLVFALRYLFTHVPKALAEWKESRPEWGAARRGAVVSATSLGWIFVHLAAGAIVVGGFALLAHVLPIGARKEADELVRVHRQGLDDSYHALDFTRVRYHAAQLTILDPGSELTHRAAQARAELIRTAFARPGLLTTAAGLRELSRQIAEADALDRRAAPEAGTAPDVLTVRCHLGWQLATTQSAELDAVSACARALDAQSSTAAFALRPLAARYVRLFLARTPLAYETNADRPYDVAGLSRLVANERDEPSALPLDGAEKYDELVLALDRASSNAYVALLDAQADLSLAAAALPRKARVPAYGTSAAGLAAPERAVADAKRARLERARDVIAAWRTFDAQLEAAPELRGSELTLSVLTLNDAPLSQALWYEAHPDELGDAPSARSEKDSAARIAMAPIRIAWARRYLVALSDEVQALVGYEESERFTRYESAALDFQKAYLAYRKAQSTSGAPRPDAPALRDAAALAAGALGIYTSRGNERPEPLGVALLSRANAPASSSDVATQVREAYDAQRLRLL
ncbi:MAG TPA: hypothetical protein VMG12_00450, partial [Polyangiaceae bacterium]|nr:hypothetical protein [Polyangiaceae bacterium]